MKQIDSAINQAKFDRRSAMISDRLNEMERQEWLLSKLELAKRLIYELGFTDYPYISRDSLQYNYELNELHCDGLVVLRNATFEGVKSVVMALESC